MQKFYTLGVRTGKLFDILIVFLNVILEKVNFEKKPADGKKKQISADNSHHCQARR